jgi:cytidine deaminase
VGFEPIDEADEELVAAARDVLSRNYRPDRHTVGAAVRAGSGAVYTGVNVEACGYGPCAEPIAVGAAFSTGEREIQAIVAVCKRGNAYPVLPPCGNCRQLILDYSPDATVILELAGQLVKTSARDLLPAAFQTWPDDVVTGAG